MSNPVQCIHTWKIDDSFFSPTKRPIIPSPFVVIIYSFGALVFRHPVNNMNLLIQKKKTQPRLYRSSSLLLIATATQHSHIWSMTKDFCLFFNGQNFFYNKDTSPASRRQPWWNQQFELYSFVCTTASPSELLPWEFFATSPVVICDGRLCTDWEGMATAR